MEVRQGSELLQRSKGHFLDNLLPSFHDLITFFIVYGWVNVRPMSNYNQLIHGGIQLTCAIDEAVLDIPFWVLFRWATPFIMGRLKGMT